MDTVCPNGSKVSLIILAIILTGFLIILAIILTGFIKYSYFGQIKH